MNAGFTLFEIVVTLAILSVTLALVGPSLMVRKPSADDVLASRLADARLAATHGGKSETLQMGSTQIRISPLGICIAEKSGGGVHVDPFTCSIVSGRAR